MKRIIAFGLGVLWIGSAVAQPIPSKQSPVSMPLAKPTPMSTVYQFPSPSVDKPMPPPGPALPMSTAPTVPPANLMADGYSSPTWGTGGCAQCGTPLIAGGLKPGDRSTIHRWLDWICFTPGPRVIPIMTPTPYHAPLRTYFPCRPNSGCQAPQPATDAPCDHVPLFGFRMTNLGEGGCRQPLLGGARSSWFGNGGLCVRSPGCSLVPGPVCYGHSPAVVSIADKCSNNGCHGTGFGRIGTMLDNLKELFIPGKCRALACGENYGADLVPGCTGANCVPGGVPGPTLAGYRLACPVGYPVPMGAYPSGATAAYQQQIARVPFTNP